jgi:type IV fimbrial biogenesis protein FimT
MKTANSSSPFFAPARGFTLLELMTALAVLGILIGIGVPSFNSMMRNSQIAAESGNLMSALTLARSEALKRGLRVSLCGAAPSMDECSEDGKWNNGWILFEDDFGDMGVFDDSDVLLQTWGAPADGVTVATDATFVSFTREARAEFGETFAVSKTGCSGTQQRQIDVNISGRVGLKLTPCT